MKKIALLFSGILSSFLFINAQKRGYNVGDRVADFKLENVDNKMVSLSNFFNTKGFIIVFISNSCPYSLAAIAEMNRLNTQYQPLGYPLIAINSNDSDISPEDGLEEMKRHAWRNNYKYPYLKDDKKEVSNQFGATTTPQVYVLERTPNGYFVRYVGAIDNNTNVNVDNNSNYNNYDNYNRDTNYNRYDNYDNYYNYNRSNYYNDQPVANSNNNGNNNSYNNNDYNKSRNTYVEDVVDNLIARTPQFIQITYTKPVGCDIR